MSDTEYKYEGYLDTSSGLPIPSDVINLFVDYDLGLILGGTYSDDPEVIKQQMDYVISQNKENGVVVNIALFRKLDY